MKLYGAKHYMKLPEAQEELKSIVLEQHDVSNPMQSEESKQDLSMKWMGLYGVS